LDAGGVEEARIRGSSIWRLILSGSAVVAGAGWIATGAAATDAGAAMEVGCWSAGTEVDVAGSGAAAAGAVVAVVLAVAGLPVGGANWS
jgi:hypothetical protein